jgi:DNA-binding transcriptional LysR family regulator
MTMKNPLLKHGAKVEDWNLLRSFLAIYDTGTLTAAAIRLGSTQPSMGRHLRELESLLGETLFTRLPGRLKPNATAQALFESSLPIRHAIREAEHLLSGGAIDIAGTVRVATSEIYGYHVIPAMITPLLQQHRELEIELSVSNQSDNLLRRDADIAVRFFRPTQGDLIAVKVGETALGLYAHEEYLARHGEPDDIDLREQDLMAGNDRQPLQLAGVIQGPAPTKPLRFRFRSDFFLAREAAVLAGQAVGMMFVDIARSNPQLKRVLASRVQLHQEVWLCAHDELRRSARMRLVWDTLEHGLRARFAAAGS